MSGANNPLPAPSPQVRAQAIAELRHYFPGVLTWYGEKTNIWWAMLPVGRAGSLIEAATPQDLAVRIRQGLGWVSQ